MHLDTDIGGDIDDFCALALLLNWPEVDITGITTVLEDAGKRAGYARYALALAQRPDIPVAAGADLRLGCFGLPAGLPPEERYWDGVTIETLPLALEIEAGQLRERIAAGGRPYRVVTGVDREKFNTLWLSTVTRR